MRPLVLTAAAVCVLGLAGCGPSVVEVSGRVVKAGEPFKPQNAEDLQVIFVPLDSNGVMCVAAVRTDGTFKMMGPTGGNIPTGTYRVELPQAYSRSLKGEFEGEKSPLSYTAVGGESAQKIVIDVAAKTVTAE